MAEFPSAARYLPAERSGILESHRLLASALVRQAPLIGIEPMSFPGLTGVVGDFIGNLLNVETRFATDFVPVAEDLERRLLGGTIDIETQAQAYPELSYKIDGSKFPLARASSMVSEVAPVVLYLKYLLHPYQVLIIEEPESHLHPSSQVKLAETLCELVNMNLRIVVTTHSEYFLAQINNAIRAGTLARVSARPRPRRAARTLTAEQVSAYLFAKSKRPGTSVRRIKVTAEDGISEDEFSRVAARLYDQTVDLDERLLGDDYAQPRRAAPLRLLLGR